MLLQVPATQLLLQPSDGMLLRTSPQGIKWGCAKGRLVSED